MIAFLLCQLSALSGGVHSAPIAEQSLQPYYAARHGYVLTVDVFSPPFAAQCTLPDGSRVVFDGVDVKRLHATGETLLLHFPAFVFPSFVVPSPDATFAIVAESTNNDLFRVPLNGGAPALLANVVLAYDACFEGAAALLVSAAPCGFNCGSDLVRVDVASGAQSTIGHVAGASGPLAFAASGDLVYGQGPSSFPAPPQSFRLLRWSSALIAASAFLDQTNATTWVDHLDGAADLTFDAASQWLFVAQSRVFGESQVLAFRPDATFGGVVIEARRWISNLEVLDARGTGTLESFQPAGRELACIASDFNYGTSDRALRVAPSRTTLTLDLSTPLKLHVKGGAPSGSFRVMVAGSALWTLPETALPGFPFTCFSGAPSTALQPLGAFVPLDPAGDGMTLLPSLGVPGTHVLQVFVADYTGRLVASSTPAFD
jgi:hypothetical protein